VPVILNGGAETEGLDIAVGYDRNMLEVTDVTLAGGILEHEGYRLVTNPGDGHIRIAVFAVSENLFTGDGAILFISFNVIGTGPGSVLEITEFQCNETPVSDEYGSIRETGSLSGGFYTDGIMSQHLGIRIRTEYDLSMHDLNDDGRIGMEDAVQALQEGSPERAIRALQSASGIK